MCHIITSGRCSLRRVVHIAPSARPLSSARGSSFGGVGRARRRRRRVLARARRDASRGHDGVFMLAARWSHDAPPLDRRGEKQHTRLEEPRVQLLVDDDVEPRELEARRALGDDRREDEHLRPNPPRRAAPRRAAPRETRARRDDHTRRVRSRPADRVSCSHTPLAHTTRGMGSDGGRERRNGRRETSCRSRRARGRSAPNETKLCSTFRATDDGTRRKHRSVVVSYREAHNQPLNPLLCSPSPIDRGDVP